MIPRFVLDYFENFHQLSDNKDFLKLFFGRFVTNIGNSVYYVASMWLVYSLTSSSFYTGLVGFLVLLPQLFEFLTGPIVDNTNLRLMLIVTQIGQGLLLLVITIAHFFGHLTVELLLVIMPLVAVIEQFVYPTQNALLPKLVDDDRLASANSLFSISYQGIDMSLNAAAGILVAVVGTTVLIAADVITFAIAALLFWWMVVPDNEQLDDSGESNEKQSNPETTKTTVSKSLQSYKQELVEGLQYVVHTPIVWMASRRGILNFVNGAAMAVLPAFAAQTGGPELYGFYLAAISAGVFVGAATAVQFEARQFGYLVPAADLISGGMWILALSIPIEVVSIGLFAVAWIPVGITTVLFSTALQAGVEENKLGRVFSINSSISVGMMPFGSLLGGYAASIVGVSLILYSLGVLFLLVGVGWFLVDELRSMPAIDGLEFSA